MSKLIFFILISFNSLSIFGQNENKGTDNNPILNLSESEYFNTIFSHLNPKLDFTDKKTAFISIDLGTTIRSKNDFFKYYSPKKSDSLLWDVLILDSLQKVNSAGFDVIILLDKKAKDLTNKKIDKLITELKVSEKNKPNNLYNLGLDDNPTISTYEAEYFNKSQANKYGFDFKNKKVGFFYGNNGSNHQSKSNYFDLLKNRLGNNTIGSMDTIIRLTESEKNESGGYDFVIISWSKTLVTTIKPKMINKLKNNSAQHGL